MLKIERHVVEIYFCACERDECFELLFSPPFEFHDVTVYTARSHGFVLYHIMGVLVLRVCLLAFLLKVVLEECAFLEPESTSYFLFVCLV